MTKIFISNHIKNYISKKQKSNLSCMKKKLKSIITLILLLLTVLYSNPWLSQNLIDNNVKQPNISGNWVLGRILIDEYDPSYTWSKTAAENDWCNGSGTWQDPYIIENVIVNTYSGWALTIAYSTSYFIIRNSQINYLGTQAGRGSILIFSDNGRFINNTFSNSYWFGIDVVQSDNHTFTNNTFSNNGFCGIYFESGNNYNTISDNVINSNEQGILFGPGNSKNIISGNIIKSNSEYGIILEQSNNNNTISGNIIKNNGKSGISIKPYSSVANYNNISGNIVSFNGEYGIYIYAEFGETNYNFIIGNNVSYNFNYGLYLRKYGNPSYCKDNVIYNNIFIDDIVRDDGNPNFWNNSQIGNYYSNYPYRDQDDDGLGDFPYNIPGSAASNDYKPIWDDGIESGPYFIDDPEPFQMIEGNPSNNITWTPIDINKNYDSYWIFRNGTLITKELWNGSQIVFNGLSTLTPNNYEFTCFVNDTDGSEVSSSVLIIIEYDNIPPIITILNPIQNSLHGFAPPPYFEISIEEFNLNSTWYSVNNGKNNTITTLNGEIDTNEWDNCGNGTHFIKFFANDTNGNIGTSIVNILKDTYSPQITIYSPQSNNIFGSVSPFFNISIDEPHLQSIFYRLNGGLNYSISGTSGIINQVAWNACGNGTVIITFELWDLAGNSEIMDIDVKKDVIPPNIIINQPISLSLYSHNAPTFEIEIIEGNLNETWYSLNNGPNYTFTGNVGIINQGAWDACGNGTIVIRFYAKDSLDKISFNDVKVYKDIIAPEITIFEPNLDEVFGIAPPKYNVSIQDNNLNSTWYSLNGGDNHSFSSDYGDINITAWNSCSEGLVIIKFFANDTLGNLNFEEIEIIKDSNLPEITINSPDALALFGLTAPLFNVSIIDSDLNASWYSLNDGTRITFPDSIGNIDQDAWDLCGNGTVKISFFANNSAGHIAFNEVIVRKETKIPIITVISPLVSEVFGKELWQFEISIDDSNIDLMWYSLNDGENYTFSNLIGTISSMGWDICEHGPVSLRFYTNNTAGNIGSTEVIIFKDLIGPEIIIISPTSYKLFGNATIDFEVYIDDSLLETTWYALEGGLNYTFIGFSGTIIQEAWDSCGNGTVSIKFYANDTLGNIGFSEVTVQKDIFLPGIIINLPTLNQLCGIFSPSYDVTIIGTDINTSWYILNETYAYEFNSMTGRIDQEKWDLFGDGIISIKFYANNSIGHYVVEEVRVLKQTYLTERNAYAIVIGISNYPGSADDLSYCDDDAIAVYNMLINDYNFKPENIIYLQDSSAIKNNINNAFNTINSKLKPDDIFYFYYSGHDGADIVTSNPTTLYIQSPHFYPNNYDREWWISSSNAAYIRVHFETLDLENNYDYLYLGDTEIDSFYYQALTGYRTNFWSDWIPVLNDNRIYLNLETDSTITGWGFRIDQIQVMRYSDPHYLNPYDSIPNNPSNNYLDTLIDSRLDSLNCEQKYVIIDACNSGGIIPEVQASNRFIITACKAGQLSYETSLLNHGIFTYYLLNSFDNANDNNNDGVISMEEVFSYVSSGTKSYSGSFGPGSQYQPQKSDGITGEAVLYPSIGSLSITPVGNQLFYSFYLYGHGFLKTLNITVSSIFPTITFKTEEIKYNMISPTGFGYYSGVINVTVGFTAGGIQLFAEIEGNQIITIDLIIGDSDGDGLTDIFEILYGNGLDPNSNDTDSDGLNDYEEFYGPSDPLNSDTDSDGLLDGEEVNIYGTDPLLDDTDLDGLTDYEEINTYNTDPLSNDSDLDNLSDGDEINIHFTNPINNDTDSDNLSDGDEINTYNTNPLSNDTDSDILLDFEEIFVYLTSPLLNDTDYDGLSDYDEIFIYLTNPLEEDTDSDGLSDYDELNTYTTDPLNADTDSDTIPDGWEVNNLLDPFTNDTALDPDNDLLTNLEEYQLNTQPFNNDTDSDGLLDGEEVNNYNTDPLQEDTDTDGLLDGEEVNTYNTDPLQEDTDSDGLLDGEEVNSYNTDPLSGDTDSDSMPDKWEIDNLLNPLVNDTTLDPDNDLLMNILEYQHGTNPQDPDTDNDNWTDGDEVLVYDTDPLDPNDHPNPRQEQAISGYSLGFVIFITAITITILIVRHKKKRSKI